MVFQMTVGPFLGEFNIRCKLTFLTTLFLLLVAAFLLLLSFALTFTTYTAITPTTGTSGAAVI